MQYPPNYPYGQPPAFNPPNERILYQGSPSPVIFFNRYLYGVIHIVLGILAIVLFSKYTGHLHQLFIKAQIYTITPIHIYYSIVVLGWLIILRGIFFKIVFPLIRSLSIKYRITDQRITIEHGILNKRIDNLELLRIRDITLSRPLIQRIFNSGNLHIVSTDASGPFKTLMGIQYPEEVWQNLLKIIRPAAVHEFR